MGMLEVQSMGEPRRLSSRLLCSHRISFNKMPTGYEISLQDFRDLIKHISRSHINQIAGKLGVRTSMRNKLWIFKGSQGDIVSIDEIYKRTQSKTELQRSVYNLWMGYFR